MPLRLLTKKPAYDTPEEELYRRVHTIIYDQMDNLTPLQVTGVLSYITHEVMHDALGLAEDED